MIAALAFVALTATPTPFPVEPPTTHTEQPPVFDVPLEAAPTTTTPAVAVPPSAAPAGVVTHLPATGTDATETAAWAAGLLAAAGVILLGGRCCRNRKDIR